MKRTNTVVAACEGRTERIARVGCALVDRLQAQQTPENLDEFQDYVRLGLIIVAERLASLRWRVKGGRRSSRLAARFGGRSDFPQILEGVRARADRFEAVLKRHAAILRMIADTAAWVALREDPRRIAPLFAPHTHELPDGIGHAGPLAILEALHADGRFLAVQCDLTRCLGVGDIVVVPTPGREPEIGEGALWSNPLALEIKSSGQAIEGSLAYIQIIAPSSEAVPDAALYHAVTEVLGTTETPAFGAPHRPASARVKRQEAELIQSAELLQVLNAAGVHASLQPSDVNWSAIDRVVQRALTPMGGPCFDIPESGLAFLAAGISNEGRAGALSSISARLEELGIPKGSPHLPVRELVAGDEMTPHVPPIPLWPISTTARVALLAGSVELAAIFSASLWKNAWHDQGLRWEDDHGWWIVDTEIAGRTIGVRFDPLEVKRLRYGVAFGGISPRATAAAVITFLSSKAGPSGSVPTE